MQKRIIGPPPIPQKENIIIINAMLDSLEEPDPLPDVESERVLIGPDGSAWTRKRWEKRSAEVFVCEIKGRVYSPFEPGRPVYRLDGSLDSSEPLPQDKQQKGKPTCRAESKKVCKTKSLSDMEAMMGKIPLPSLWKHRTLNSRQRARLERVYVSRTRCRLTFQWSVQGCEKTFSRPLDVVKHMAARHNEKDKAGNPWSDLVLDTGTVSLGELIPKEFRSCKVVPWTE